MLGARRACIFLLGGLQVTGLMLGLAFYSSGLSVLDPSVIAKKRHSWQKALVVSAVLRLMELSGVFMFLNSLLSRV